MLIGNQAAQYVLQKVAQKLQQGEAFARFFLLSGPSSVGKTTFAQKLIVEPLMQNGLLLPWEFVFLQDFGKLGEQSQPIKIEQKELSVQIGDKTYPNWWVRELAERAYLKPAWKYKLVLIQNLERLTLAAANAFLKLLEEPPSYFVIVATTSNKQNLLDTILSRAFLVRFSLVSPSILLEQLKAYFSQHWIFVQDLENLALLSQGKPWVAIRLAKDSQIEQILHLVRRLKTLVKTDGRYAQKVEVLQEIFEQLWRQDGYEAVLHLLYQQNHPAGFKKWLKAKNFASFSQQQQNINFLIYLSLALDKSVSKKI